MSKKSPSVKIGYVYDEKMTMHKDPTNERHLEGPQRIKKAREVIEDCGLLEKMIKIPSRY